MSNDPLGKSSGRRNRVVAEEADDPREVPQAGFCGFHFPVVDGGFIHPELLSHLGLEQAEVKSALSEMVAYRNELSGIGL